MERFLAILDDIDENFHHKLLLEDIRKGASIHLFGRIRCRNYTSASGEQRTFTEIVVSKFDIKA